MSAALRASRPFVHDGVHDLAALARVEDALKSGTIASGQALTLAQNLLAHVHPATPAYFKFLGDNYSHSGVQTYVRFGLQAYEELRACYRLEELKPQRRERLYDRETPLFLRKPGAGKLLVVFATMYNNFFFSNAAIVALLFPRLDCSLLILKDCSLFNYLYGANGFGDTLPQLGQAIVDLARQERLEHIYIAGFSSSGYAALYTSLTIPCRGYLGFSHAFDLRLDSTLPPPTNFTRDVQVQVDPAMLLDLKPMLLAADPAIDRQFFYSSQGERDAPQGRHVEDVPTLQVTCFDSVNHNVIAPMLAAGTLLPAFVRLTSG